MFGVIICSVRKRPGFLFLFLFVVSPPAILVPFPEVQATTAAISADGADIGSLITKPLHVVSQHISPSTKPEDVARKRAEQSWMLKHLQSLSEEEMDVIKEAEIQAQRYVRARVKLITEPRASSSIADRVEGFCSGWLVRYFRANLWLTLGELRPEGCRRVNHSPRT